MAVHKKGPIRYAKIVRPIGLLPRNERDVRAFDQISKKGMWDQVINMLLYNALDGKTADASHSQLREISAQMKQVLTHLDNIYKQSDLTSGIINEMFSTMTNLSSSVSVLEDAINSNPEMRDNPEIRGHIEKLKREASMMESHTENFVDSIEEVSAPVNQDNLKALSKFSAAKNKGRST